VHPAVVGGVLRVVCKVVVVQVTKFVPRVDQWNTVIAESQRVAQKDWFNGKRDRLFISCLDRRFKARKTGRSPGNTAVTRFAGFPEKTPPPAKEAEKLPE